MRGVAYMAALSVGAAGLLPCGCGAGGGVSLRSMGGTAELRGDLPLMAYWWSDKNTADFYLTDLADEDLGSGADWRGVSGQIVHVHMFLRPKAGVTPIEDSACTVTVRHMVIARGEVGLYAGGGFMSLSGSAGDSTFGGSVRGATLRLERATAGFRDVLGASEFRGSFRAPRDERTAAEIGAKFHAAVLALGAAGD